MATNYRQSGETGQYTAATGGHTSGDFVLKNGIVTVVHETVTGSGNAIVLTDGVYAVTTKVAATGEAWTFGQKIYLTPTGDFTATATGNTYAGRSWEDSTATGATTGEVRINWGNL